MCRCFWCGQKDNEPVPVNTRARIIAETESILRFDNPCGLDWRLSGQPGIEPAGDLYDVLEPGPVEQAAVAQADMGEFSVSTGANINSCASDRCQLRVSGNEIGVQVRFKNVADGNAMLSGGFQVDVNISLEINDDCLTLGYHHVGSVCETAKIKLFEVRRSPSELIFTDLRIDSIRPCANAASEIANVGKAGLA